MKNNLILNKLISAGDMSTASITSIAQQVMYLDDIGIQINFTGTPTGSFEIQISADHVEDAQGNVKTAGNWVPMTFTTAPVASGAAGSIYLDIATLSAPYLRVVYTRVSGTGSLDVFVTGKAI